MMQVLKIGLSFLLFCGLYACANMSGDQMIFGMSASQWQQLSPAEQHEVMRQYGGR